MKLLVTGGLGFIGSNFIIKLLKENENFEIINVDAEFTGSNTDNVTEVQNLKNYQFVQGNITNKILMEKLITKSDAVINFAAETFVDKSIKDANPFLVSNIRGAFTLLDIVTKQKKRMIQISTDEVFGSLNTGSADEQSKFNPSNPYAATKAAAELLVNSYCKTFDSDIIITRCTNNYGPRQFAEKLIPKTIILAYQDKKIPIYGKGANVRDWIFVDDHCNAILDVLQNGDSGDSYNISANNEISNLQVVKTILKVLNKSEDLIEFVEDRPGHDFRYSLNSSKISKKLGWSVKASFEDSIKKTIQWYLNNPDVFGNTSSITSDFTPWKNSNKQ
tara:strand:+ start:145 stop:1143 length:999 start_codon:yes stop_codon:yes gene_type:complete